MRRTAIGKHLALTGRDIEIFNSLARYRFLRSTYLHALAGGTSETRFKERLGDLFHEGYVDRPSQQWEFASGRHSPAVYELGSGARRILQELGSDLTERRVFLGDGAHRQFQHSLMICEILASCDLAVRQTPGLRFIGWSEILAKAPEPTRRSIAPFRLKMPSGGVLVPDGLFGIEYTADGARKYRFFALEADRGTMPIERSSPKQSCYAGKIAAYSEIIAQGVSRTHLGIPNLIMLTVTTSQTRLERMLERLGPAADVASALLFKSFECFSAPIQELLSEPWQRIGLPPLAIG
jgi:hypothetical protein